MTRDEIRQHLWIAIYVSYIGPGSSAVTMANEAVAEFDKAFPAPKDSDDGTPQETD